MLAPIHFFPWSSRRDQTVAYMMHGTQQREGEGAISHVSCVSAHQPGHLDSSVQLAGSARPSRGRARPSESGRLVLSPSAITNWGKHTKTCMCCHRSPAGHHFCLFCSCDARRKRTPMPCEAAVPLRCPLPNWCPQQRAKIVISTH